MVFTATSTFAIVASRILAAGIALLVGPVLPEDLRQPHLPTTAAVKYEHPIVHSIFATIFGHIPVEVSRLAWGVLHAHHPIPAGQDGGRSLAALAGPVKAFHGGLHSVSIP